MGDNNNNSNVGNVGEGKEEEKEEEKEVVNSNNGGNNETAVIEKPKVNYGSKAKTRCYIIRNDTNKKMTFQFNPSSVPYGRGANYASIESPGMSYPLTQYVGGQVREFSFEVFYYDRPFSGKINTARKFLEGLLPPEKNTSSFTKPPSFTFAFGYFVKVLVLTHLEISDEWLNADGQPIMSRFILTVRQVGS